MKPKILLVDDEPDALEVLGFRLREAGFTPILAKDGVRAITAARDERPALIVLDVMLPEVDGLEVCKILRRDPATAAIPILMLTARAAEMDRVLGLELGADDYVTKPFSPRELVLRIRKLLARAKAAEEPVAHLRFNELEIDAARHAVTVGGRPVELTATEFRPWRSWPAGAAECKRATACCRTCGVTRTPSTAARSTRTCGDSGRKSARRPITWRPSAA